MRVLAERALELAITAVVVECLVACTAAPPANAPARTSAADAPATPTSRAPGTPNAPAATNAPAAASSGAEGRGRPCGALDCRAFSSSREAFEAALAGSPRVVAVGEAHAQKAVAGVESATQRFTRDLLPALAPRVKGVIVELLAPDKACAAHEERAVAERAKPITEPQRDTNQSEFLALGFAAKKLGMQVEPLVPTCDELKGVLAAENDVGALLELIANVTVRETLDFLDHQKPEHAILIYGGLVHNDLAPLPGHEAWSFAPRVAEHAGKSFVEIDLVVPELIRDEAPWTELAWFTSYDRARRDGETQLFRTGPASFALIFPPTPATNTTNATDPAKATP